MSFDKHLLEILACPVCKGPLHYESDREELCCVDDKLAFPIREGIPVLLEMEARSLATTESNEDPHV